MANFSPPLEDPDTLVGGTIACIAPCCEDFFPPRIGGGNLERRLWSRHKHKVESTLQVIRLQRSAGGGGDLERGLAQRCRGEGHGGRGD